MSHFFTVVLVPKSTDANEIEATVKRMLAPYDENLEVPEYDRECYCVGRAAQRAAHDAVEAAFPIDALRAQLHDRFPRLADPGRNPFAEDEEADRAWKQMLAPRDALWQSTIDAHPLRGKPDPNCTECNGTGTYRSTYNPNSKWDWWVIGGRWEGWVSGSRDEPDGYPYHDAKVNNNVIDVELLKKAVHCDKDRTPFALITPDGKWHEKGSMGWWGMVADEKEGKNWQETVVELLDSHPDAWAVGLDLHI